MSGHKKVTGFIELVGADEAIAGADDYGASVSFTAHTEVGGICIKTCLFKQTWSTGASGAAKALAGRLVFFKSDPSISASDGPGDVANSVADEVLGMVDLETGDWDTMFASAQLAQVDAETDGVILIPQGIRTVYMAFFMTSSTALNDAGDDDEVLEVQLSYL